MWITCVVFEISTEKKSTPVIGPNFQQFEGYNSNIYIDMNFKFGFSIYWHVTSKVYFGFLKIFKISKVMLFKKKILYFEKFWFEKFKILKIRDSHYKDKLIPYTIMSYFCFLLETPIYDNFLTEQIFFVENAKHALHKTILEPPLINIF